MSLNRSARVRRWALRAALGAGVLLATTGCQSNAFTRMGFLPPVTKQGKVVLTLWQGSWIAAWAVGIVVWGIIICAIIFFRKRSDRVPYQVRYNLPIEILYTVVPFIMVGILFYFTARDENYVDALSARGVNARFEAVADETHNGIVRSDAAVAALRELEGR